MSLSPVRDSLGIVFVRFFNRPCVPARRMTFELQTGATLARFLAGCSQNGALISNLRSACRLAQSAVSYSSFQVRGILAHVIAPFPSGSGLGHRLFPEAGFFRIGASTLGPVRSGSAAVCAGLRCLLLVGKVSRPGPDARLFFVLRKRFLNLGGRGRAADQTLASQTLIPGHALHEKGLQRQIGVGTQVSSQE